MDWRTWDSSIIAAWIAAIAAIASAIYPLITGMIWIWDGLQQSRTQRLLEKRVGANLYTSSVLDQATRYYIEPDCSNIDPAREEEVRNVRAPKEKAFAAIDDFFEKQSIYRHMIILADSGMGKTSLLINYFVRNHNQRNPHKIKLLPIGIPDLEQLIEDVQDKERTTIFLDAFDEDTKAIADHKERLSQLMYACRHFDRVVITCRTQFFPDDEEIPKETGIVRVGPRAGGEGAIYIFQKLYLMPLTDKQVASYLRKRYPLWQWSKRRRAHSIIKKVPLLSVRPMLLTHIPDMLNQELTITYSFELYEAMVGAWLQREQAWVDPQELRSFSERLAVDLYVNRQLRGSERLLRKELSRLVKEWDISLGLQQISGRSLLNRDADGNLKFAHRSIMEYLFLQCDVSGIKQDWSTVKLTDQMMVFVQEAAQSQRLLVFKNLPNCDLSNVFIDLAGGDLTRTNLQGANLQGANLKKANLDKANLGGTKLRNTNLREASLRYANLAGANLSGANLSNANLEGINLKDADLFGADLRKADLSQANIAGANLAETDLMKAELKGTKYNSQTIWPDGFDHKNSGAIGPYANLVGINLTGANLAMVDLTGANLTGANLTGATLMKARVRDCLLARANLRGANLEGANLQGVNLTGAQYDSRTRWPHRFDYQNCGAVGPSANLTGSDLRGANLEGVNLWAAILNEAELTGAQYDNQTKWPDGFDYRNSGAIGPYANLKGVDLAGNDLKGANLTKADLTEANMRNVNLKGAVLDEANLTRADLWGANLLGTDLGGATLTGTNLWAAKYDNSTRWPLKFVLQNSGAIGPHADLSKANLIEAYLAEASLCGANLREADLLGANLKGADLSEADLTEARLWKADLTEANLVGANLKGAQLRQAHLEDSNLGGANLVEADLTEAILKGASYDSQTRWPDGFDLQKSGVVFKPVGEP